MSQPSAFRRVYRYDDRDQLVAVEDDQGWRIDYQYDASGNRTRRRVTATGPVSGPTVDEPSSEAQGPGN